jgi:hypothetical protein
MLRLSNVMDSIGESIGGSSEAITGFGRKGFGHWKQWGIQLKKLKNLKKLKTLKN